MFFTRKSSILIGSMYFLLCTASTVFANDIPVQSSASYVDVWTFEELVEQLEESQRDVKVYIRIQNDICIPAGESYVSYPDRCYVIDLGPHTIYVEGSIQIQSGMELVGRGGDQGLIHAEKGGEVQVHNALLKAEEGYAVWQDEGAVLGYTPLPDSTGMAHYAEKAVAVPYSFISPKVAMPVVVVHDGQKLEDILPKTDCVRLYQNGMEQIEEYIPVIWDTRLEQNSLDARKRTLITGIYPDAEAVIPPTCLVVFQNSCPAVFLDCWGMESYGKLLTKVKVELAEPEYDCRFEWSQDGENWLSADARKAVVSEDGRLAFIVSCPQEEEPSYPYYLTAVVDYPDGSSRYSEILMIAGANGQCDSGGNRGGGTDIVDPPSPELSKIPSASSEVPAKSNLSAVYETPVTSNLFVTSKAIRKPDSVTWPQVLFNEEFPEKPHTSLSMTAETSNQALKIFGDTKQTAKTAIKETPRRGTINTRITAIAAGVMVLVVMIGAAGIFHSPACRKRCRIVLNRLLRNKR